MNHFKIRNAVVFVTGANRGIGKALVETALESGAVKVYAAARRVETLQALVNQGQGRVVPVALDITSQEQIQNAVRQAQDVTLLINNAGVAAYSGFVVDARPQAAEDEMRVNYFGTMHMAMAFAPVLKKNGGCILVNIVSVAAFQSFPGFGSYCASKAAEHLLTLGLRQELAPQGTFVAGVYPGPVDTDMAAGVPMEKESPRQVAINVYKGLEEGREDIWPDAFALELSQKLNRSAPARGF